MRKAMAVVALSRCSEEFDKPNATIKLGEVWLKYTVENSGWIESWETHGIHFACNYPRTLKNGAVGFKPSAVVMKVGKTPRMACTTAERSSERRCHTQTGKNTDKHFSVLKAGKKHGTVLCSDRFVLMGKWTKRELITKKTFGRAVFTEDLSHARVSNRGTVLCSDTGVTGLAWPLAVAEIPSLALSREKNIRIRPLPPQKKKKKEKFVHMCFHKNHFPLL